MKALKLMIVLSLLAAVVMTGCSKDDNPSQGGPTYYGTFAGPSESGSMTTNFASAPSKVSSAIPNDAAAIITVTGTIKIDGGATINLTGTYDTETDSLKISGGGYSFAGTFSSGEVSGNYDGPSGSGSFIITASASGTVKVYCGEYHEVSPGTGSGKINILLDGAAITVLVRNESGDDVNVFKGALSGSSVTIYVSGTSGPVLATGSMDNEAQTSMSGEYQTESEIGTWFAELCQ